MAERMFSAEDVRRVATAMLEAAIDHNEGDRGRYECRHCGAEIHWRADDDTMIHKLDCPVLVARDLLT